MTAPHCPVSCGQTMPSGTAAPTLTAAMTSICTTDIPAARLGIDSRPRPMMCKAYSAAAPRVSASPKPTLKPCKDSNAKPAVASVTAYQVLAGTRSRSSRAVNTGVSTT